MSDSLTSRQVLALAGVRRFARSGEARRLRLRCGLSLSEMATALGASTGAVSRWERGERRPTGQRGVAYAQLISELAAQDAEGNGSAA